MPDRLRLALRQSCSMDPLHVADTPTTDTHFPVSQSNLLPKCKPPMFPRKLYIRVKHRSPPLFSFLLIFGSFRDLLFVQVLKSWSIAYSYSKLQLFLNILCIKNNQAILKNTSLLLLASLITESLRLSNRTDTET